MHCKLYSLFQVLLAALESHDKGQGQEEKGQEAQRDRRRKRKKGKRKGMV